MFSICFENIDSLYARQLLRTIYICPSQSPLQEKEIFITVSNGRATKRYSNMPGSVLKTGPKSSESGRLVLTASSCAVFTDTIWRFLLRDRTYTFCDGGNHGYDNEFKSMEVRWFLVKPGTENQAVLGEPPEYGIYDSFWRVLFVPRRPDMWTVNTCWAHTFIWPSIDGYETHFLGLTLTPRSHRDDKSSV